MPRKQTNQLYGHDFRSPSNRPPAPPGRPTRGGGADLPRDSASPAGSRGRIPSTVTSVGAEACSRATSRGPCRTARTAGATWLFSMEMSAVRGQRRLEGRGRAGGRDGTKRCPCNLLAIQGQIFQRYCHRLGGPRLACRVLVRISVFFTDVTGTSPRLRAQALGADTQVVAFLGDLGHALRKLRVLVQDALEVGLAEHE